MLAILSRALSAAALLSFTMFSKELRQRSWCPPQRASVCSRCWRSCPGRSPRRPCCHSPCSRRSFVSVHGVLLSEPQCVLDVGDLVQGALRGGPVVIHHVLEVIEDPERLGGLFQHSVALADCQLGLVPVGLHPRHEMVHGLLLGLGLRQDLVELGAVLAGRPRNLV